MRPGPTGARGRRAARHRAPPGRKGFRVRAAINPREPAPRPAVQLGPAESVAALDFVTAQRHHGLGGLQARKRSSRRARARLAQQLKQPPFAGRAQRLPSLRTTLSGQGGQAGSPMLAVAPIIGWFGTGPSASFV